MSSKIETLFTNINLFFNNKKWACAKTTNKLCFSNKHIPYDEYVIEAPSNDEITVSIPVNSVAYKKTFYNINEIVNYLQMHIDFYNEKNRY